MAASIPALPAEVVDPLDWKSRPSKSPKGRRDDIFEELETMIKERILVFDGAMGTSIQVGPSAWLCSGAFFRLQFFFFFGCVMLFFADFHGNLHHQ